MLKGETYKVIEAKDGQLIEKEVLMLNAVNEVLRDDYINDSVAGVESWNKVLDKACVPVRLMVLHKAFHRNIGLLFGVRVSPDGRVVTQAEWNAGMNQWLPSNEGWAYIASLMGQVTERGKFANWIEPPAMDLNRQPGDTVQVIGRFGASFLMPNHPRSSIVMICTGTGSTSMRATTEWPRRLRKSGKLRGWQADAVFWCPYATRAAVLRPAAKPAQRFHRYQFRFLAHFGRAQTLCARRDAQAGSRPGAACRSLTAIFMSAA